MAESVSLCLVLAGFFFSSCQIFTSLPSLFCNRVWFELSSCSQWENEILSLNTRLWKASLLANLLLMLVKWNHSQCIVTYSYSYPKALAVHAQPVYSEQTSNTLTSDKVCEPYSALHLCLYMSHCGSRELKVRDTFKWFVKLCNCFKAVVFASLTRCTGASQ